VRQLLDRNKIHSIEEVERVFRETSILSSLEHKNVIRLIEVRVWANVRVRVRAFVVARVRVRAIVRVRVRVLFLWK